MSSIDDVIKQRRPNLSPSSVKTYSSILRNLYKKLNPEHKELNVKFFDKQDDIINALANMEPNKRKTILSALVIITDNNKKYLALMNQDADKVKEFINKNEKTEAQKENWINGDQIKKLFDEHLLVFSNIIKKAKVKDKLDMVDLQKAQDFIILILTSGLFIPPRRLMDYTQFVIKDADKDKDNFFDVKAKKFVFNKFKTTKFYGTQEVELKDPKFIKYIKAWMKLNPYPTLLVDTLGHALTSVKLNQRMNKIYGKKISVNILRHSFLSEKYNIEDMKKTANEMGHSINEQIEYIKK